MLLSALPATVRHEVEALEPIVAAWPVDVTMDRVLQWMLQFDSADYPLATRVAMNLQVLGSAAVRRALEAAHVKLQRRMASKGAALSTTNTLYAAIGNSSKSGGLISYHYRTTLALSDADFLDGEEPSDLELGKVANIVFVDDVIGTGKTIASELKTVGAELVALSNSRNLFVLTVAGYRDGIQHIETETGASVVCALEYGVTDTARSLDGDLFSGLPPSERQAMQDKLRSYCRGISRSDLGFGGVGGLLVFDHNTPNTTLPVVWARGRNWKPLFPRATTIPGAAKVLRSAERQREADRAKKSPAAKSRSAADMDVTLFVEGKLDELFVDYLLRNRALAEKLGVRSAVGIALGGLYQSTRLLELLRDTRKDAIFVLDEDEYSRRAASANLAEVRVVYLKPSFTALLDYERIYAARDRYPGLPERASYESEVAWCHDLERALLKRGPVGSNAERITQIIDEFLDTEKYAGFVETLSKQLAAMGALTPPS